MSREQIELLVRNPEKVFPELYFDDKNWNNESFPSDDVVEKALNDIDKVIQ